MPNIGVPELLIILVVVMLLFGSTRVPRLARSLGQARREFHAGIGSEDITASETDDGRAQVSER